MGVGLGTQSVGLGLKDSYRVRTGREPHRGRSALGQRYERSGELRRVAARVFESPSLQGLSLMV